MANITPPPNPGETEVKKGQRAETISTTVRKKLFAGTDRDDGCPNAKKAKHK